MRVRFLENKMYSPNGWDNKTSLKGETEEISQELAEAFIKQKICSSAEKKATNEKSSPVEEPAKEEKSKPVEKKKAKKGRR